MWAMLDKPSPTLSSEKQCQDSELIFSQSKSFRKGTKHKDTPSIGHSVKMIFLVPV